MLNDQTKRVAISILQYLRTHPSAQDTASGIAQWWVHDDRETVKKALKLLVKEGTVEFKNNVYRMKQK
jgi:hypothetical protein